MDTVEEFCICKEAMKDSELSDKHRLQPNKLS
jgi:hypothetical protein